MNLRYITFPNREVEAKGLIQVALRTRIDAVPDGVYVVSDDGIAVLQELSIPFQETTLEQIPAISATRTRSWGQS